VIHSVKSPTTAHWFAPSEKATRQNAGSRTKRPKPANWGFQCEASPEGLRSGTQRKNTALKASVAAESATKISRQSKCPSAASSGEEAVIAPKPPTENATAIMVDVRSGGNHSTKAWMEAMRHAETPRPMSVRASTRSAKDLEWAKLSAPAAASRRSTAFVRRGPNRSSSTPSGTWKRPNERKYAPVRKPKSAGVSENSADSRGPSTAFTAR